MNGVTPQPILYLGNAGEPAMLSWEKRSYHFFLSSCQRLLPWLLRFIGQSLEKDGQGNSRQVYSRHP